MESVNDSDTMEDMITFGQWSLQYYNIFTESRYSRFFAPDL